MESGALLKYIQAWSQQFEARLSELVDGLDKRVQGLQRDLVRRFLDLVADMFEFENGKLKKTPANIRALRRLEKMFDGFTGSIVKSDLKLFAKEILEVGAVTEGYFEATVPAATPEMARKAIELLRSVIGIDEAGDLIEGSYLSRLGLMQSVRDSLRDYMVQSIVSKRSLKDLMAGFKALVVGQAGIDGALQAYWRQYAYDTYNQAHEVVNSSMAEALDLRHFIYQGSIIPTSRVFCKTRAGNVYSVPETADWKNDPDLIEKKTKDAYNPMIERGRYNCRHFINYISNDLAFELRPELKAK